MLTLRFMKVSDFNLRHLRAAHAIGDLGSICAAAKAIHISQPAVTQGLSKLEASLGVRLFERHCTGMTPTPAARLLLPRVDAALRHIASSQVTMTQLQAFVGVAAAGGYAGASVVSGLAQPSLHRAVRDLSVVLKRPLLERRGKGVSLTTQGKRTVRRFRLACGELEAALSEVDALLGHETGKINIGAMPLARARILPAAITAFHAHVPGANIRIIEGSFSEMIEPLRDGEIDVMIGAMRPTLPGPDVKQSSLFADQPIILGRKDHPALAANVDMKALAQFSWIMPPIGTPLRDQWAQVFSDAGISVPHVPINCGSVMTIRQILMETDFLTVLSPVQVAAELDIGSLVKIADLPQANRREIGMTTRVDWRPTAMQTAFLTILQNTSKRL
ncbi:MAG: LysR substrate-binding domain-containing protein [Pseudomonadota bacterium]